MRILLSNDDGIFAPGLMALYEVLSSADEVDVVAPETVQSGGSHAITIRHPVLWRTVQVNDGFHGTAVMGTPADSVKLALNGLLSEKPDVVISGINAGLNTGIHVLYSGTVAAAIEAAIFGYPAIAVSFELHRDMDYNAAAHIARRLIDRILQDGPFPGRVFNINIPEIKPGWPKGVRVFEQSTQAMNERFEKRTGPNNRDYYWIDGDFKDIGDESDTDRRALVEGYVCVTPLQFNLTDREAMEGIREWTWPDLA